MRARTSGVPQLRFGLRAAGGSSRRTRHAGPPATGRTGGRLGRTQGDGDDYGEGSDVRIRGIRGGGCGVRDRGAAEQGVGEAQAPVRLGVGIGFEFEFELGCRRRELRRRGRLVGQRLLGQRFLGRRFVGRGLLRGRAQLRWRLLLRGWRRLRRRQLTHRAARGSLPARAHLACAGSRTPPRPGDRLARGSAGVGAGGVSAGEGESIHLREAGIGACGAGVAGAPVRLRV
ncbi:hypothetical protein SFR_3806 [Streptomyces sp. FR-008]|nr:hypothetical protein SFR_3806 [Streptomyces sp. FR-008]